MPGKEGERGFPGKSGEPGSRGLPGKNVSEDVIRDICFKIWSGIRIFLFYLSS